MEILIIFVVVVMAMMLFSGHMQRKQQRAQMDRLTKLEPGHWVITQSGFIGRLVDIDGNVAVVETEDGTETYWLKNALSPLNEPPFGTADDQDLAKDTSDEATDPEETREEEDNTAQPSGETPDDTRETLNTTDETRQSSDETK